MADIKFYGNIQGAGSASDGQEILHSTGSGVGFYGSTFGISVPIASYQDTTYVTNADGTAQGSQLSNCKYPATATGVSIQGSAATLLTNLPNYQTPLNIRFSHTSAVMVQNCKLRIFDRSDITNHASGVLTYVYEARHPSDQGSVGDLSMHGTSSVGGEWTAYDGTGSVADMVLTDSPGISGTNTSTTDAEGTDSTLKWVTREGTTHTSTRHDWFLALSASPTTIGSKTNYGLYFTCEYL